MLNYMYAFGKQFRKSVIDSSVLDSCSVPNIFFKYFIKVRLEIVQTIFNDKNLAILTLSGQTLYNTEKWAILPHRHKDEP